jgi:hypothetical protein
MPKTAKKFRNRKQVNAQINNAEASGAPVLKPIAGSQAKIQSQPYDAAAYFKKDLKWTGIVTLIVVAVLVILYIVLR